MKFVTLDFETYYDKEYSLSKMTTEAYIRDPRFEVILAGVKVGSSPATYFSGPMHDIGRWLAAFNLQDAMVLAHNMAFDGLILSHHFGIHPRFLLDTLSMARPKHAVNPGVGLAALAHHYGVGAKGDEVTVAIGKRRQDFTEEALAAFPQMSAGGADDRSEEHTS